MSFLDKITPAQKETVISLPYRVGLWISNSDATGGEESNAQEMQALSSVLHGFAEETFGSETMQRIISETIRQKSQWPGWATRTETVPDDCMTVIDLMKDYLDAKDVNAFRNYLMEIGEAVALAFQESHDRSWLSSYIAFIRFNRRRRQGQRKKTFAEFQRISPGEHRALSSLAEALGTAY